MTRAPAVTSSLADWRAQVDKELAGRSFEKALVHETAEGIPILPLYTEAPAADLFVRQARAGLFRICARSSGASSDDLRADVAGGADALWLTARESVDGLLPLEPGGATFFVLDVETGGRLDVAPRLQKHLRQVDGSRIALNSDPIGRRAEGRAPFATLAGDIEELGHLARFLGHDHPRASALMISTLPYHDAGADGADEIAIALSTGARYLEALLDAGLSAEEAAGHIALQVSVGRDTFLELCKLRALRICWQKLLVASGVHGALRPLVHAVCSHRTLTTRDPWVNMLRVTTQMFSAILGGADLVTPCAFDEALGSPSSHGRRVARNTGLVLREESFLGKVTDAAGGSYYLETLSLALAREAWGRFRTLEREGGIVAALESGRLQARLAAAWHVRLEQIARRRVPILGVSEFANLDEVLPKVVPYEATTPHGDGALPVHRDSEAFEALRTRVEETHALPEVLLVTLGSLAESRPRVGFAASFFAAGGIRVRESTDDAKALVACLCGTDERYAAEAVVRARALKEAGCFRVLVAGRPGPLEPSLREAGVDGFIFVGTDVVAILSELLADLLGRAS